MEAIQLNRGVDDKAFIFTLKNPQGVEPTRFVKRKESKYAIDCVPYCGPIFGDCSCDKFIDNYCSREDSCWIENDGKRGYECHSEYKSSLFVNTDKSDNKNYCSILDYEVYTFDICKKYVYNVCKHPDIVWDYIQTKDISEEFLKQFDDDVELLSDLDVIYCGDRNIRLKISKYCLKNPSELLPNTQLVSQEYDSILREWAGDYTWKLLYRASEHGYTGKSFHDCCDDKGPTLIVIKSDGGWLFGGYTTQSWSGRSIYNNMI